MHSQKAVYISAFLPIPTGVHGDRRINIQRYIRPSSGSVMWYRRFGLCWPHRFQPIAQFKKEKFVDVVRSRAQNTFKGAMLSWLFFNPFHVQSISCMYLWSCEMTHMCLTGGVCRKKINGPRLREHTRPACYSKHECAEESRRWTRSSGEVGPG